MPALLILYLNTITTYYIPDPPKDQPTYHGTRHLFGNNNDYSNFIYKNTSMSSPEIHCLIVDNHMLK